MLIDGVVDQLLEELELAAEHFDHSIDARPELWRHDLPAILLHGTQRGELPTVNDQVFERASVCVGGGPGGGFYDSGELSDEPSVDRVGFGELADDLGEAADLQRRHDDHGKAGGQSGADEGLLEAAGCFDDDALDAITTQRADRSADAGLLVGDRHGSVPFEDTEVELGLTDGDADIDSGEVLCHEHSALLNSGSGPIRLFELSRESMNRYTLVNGLRFRSLEP